LKKVKLIYNPYAGSGSFPSLIDYTFLSFHKQGYAVHIHKSTSLSDIKDLITRGNCQDYTAVIIAGGDGSVNMAVNTLLKGNMDIPLGIIPAGTANDFASHLGMPKDLKKAINALSRMKIREVDVGLVNGQYFINVCSSGLLTDISQKIDVVQKRKLGKIAYYLNGLQELPYFKSMELRIISQEVEIVEDLYLYLVLNGRSAGGFGKLGGPASICDGKLDFIGFKTMNAAQIIAMFPKILLGIHLKDKRVIHFQTEALRIERCGSNIITLSTDVDGEKGPDYPLNVSVLPRRLKIISPTIQ